MGKTALALNIAFNAAYKPQVPVAFFSLEMSKEQLVRRLLSGVGAVDASQTSAGPASSARAEWATSTTPPALSPEAPLFIDDTPRPLVLEIRAKARRLKAHGKLGWSVIDYLQLMRGRAEVNSRQQEISGDFPLLEGPGQGVNVPVIALSQLRRERGRGRKRPQLADLRESGAIEQDADVIMFVYRGESLPFPDDETMRGMAEIIVGKQRNGPIDTVKMHFEAEVSPGSMTWNGTGTSRRLIRTYSGMAHRADRGPSRKGSARAARGRH